MFSIKGEYMLSFSELEVDLRQLAEYYVGELDEWELRREGRDYYMLVVPQDPYILEDAFAYKAIGRMLDFIWGTYNQEFCTVSFEATITEEDTDLPYFCLKLKGH